MWYVLRRVGEGKERASSVSPLAFWPASTWTGKEGPRTFSRLLAAYMTSVGGHLVLSQFRENMYV